MSCVGRKGQGAGAPVLFSYTAGFDDDGRSVWVMMLYGYFFWFRDYR
jgi:hypothetical protein